MKTLKHAFIGCLPCRFYDGQTPAAMRKELRAACLATPTLPGGYSRLGFTLQRERRPSGTIWVCQVFDRAPAWIAPRYQKCAINENSRVCAADICTWIEDVTPELRAMSLDVDLHVRSVIPFKTGHAGISQ